MSPRANTLAGIFLCDRSGVMARPFAEAGYRCICIDTAHSIRRDRVEGNITYRWGDVRSLTPAGFARAVFEANKHLLPPDTTGKGASHAAA